MSGSVSQAEAILDNLERRLEDDARSINELEGKEPPEDVEHALKEAGEAFEDVKEDVYPGATEQELDRAEKNSVSMVQKYEQAIDVHIDYFGADKLIGPDIAINQTVNGELDRNHLLDIAGVSSRRINDLRDPGDRNKVRRQLDDNAVSEMIEQSDYDLETVVRQDYLDELYDGQESLEEGIESRRGSDGW